MGWGTAFAMSGIWGLSQTLEALTADAIAQVWEVKVPKKLRARGQDCGFMDCGRTIRFALVPGLIEGLLEGFTNGWLWDDYIKENSLWPKHFVLTCIINDCVTLFFVYPLSFRIHRRPMKQNFLVAAGASMGLKILIQVLVGLFRTNFFSSWFFGAWLPFFLFSTFMYRGAYPEIRADASFSSFKGTDYGSLPNVKDVDDYGNSY
jgi:hypothetical protein